MRAFPEHIRSERGDAVTVADEIHRVTVDEYIHIVRDLGWESTELIEGVVYDVAPEYHRHSSTVKRMFLQLHTHVVDGATYQSGSVRLGPHSMVDPDIYVVDLARSLDPDDAVPAAAVKLVVEVSVSSHARDRGPKLIAYAKAGVPEVWLVDPRPDVGELIRYRDPEGASYRTVDRFDVGEDAVALDLALVMEP